MKKVFKKTLFISAFLLVCSIMQAQSVTGKVADSDGPLPGVNVAVQNSKIGATTDFDGKFTLNNLPKDAVLTVSYLGYATQKITLNGKNEINIILVSDKVDLKEVVVVGFGSTKKKDITGAIAVVTSKEFEGRANTGIGNALEGKVAGVQITKPSGQPQAGYTIRVRGTSTITAGAEPLYILDGIPTTSIDEISPSDIESMTVLKDASSAAIYGANGSNGVILITTKRGGNQKTKVTLDAYTSSSTVSKKLDVLDATQYKALMTEMGQTTDWTQYPYNNNWQDRVLRTALSKNYSLGVSGGDEKTNYYLSGTYLDQEGVVMTNKVERYTFKLNLDHKVSKSVKVGSSIGYSKWKDVDVNEAGKFGVILNSITGAPVTDVYNADGTFSINPFIPDLESPVALVLKNDHAYQNYKFNGNVYTEIAFLKDLKFKSMFGFEQLNSTYNSWVDPYTSREGRGFKGMASLSKDQTSFWNFENTLTYAKSFNKHNFNALVGHIASEKDYSSASISARNFGSAAVHTVNAGAVRTSGFSAGPKEIREAVIGRLNYSYEDKYLMTGNFRADAYSGFGEKNRWGYFPSFSGGWRISKEDFFSGVSAINDLKLRAGWGIVGNSQVDGYAHFGQVNPGAPYVIGGLVVPGSNPSTLESSDLKWEKTEQTNIGLDVSLLKNRLSLTTDYYIKKTSDMLLKKIIPSSTGFSTAQLNVGAMENKGFEFSVSSKNLENELKWNTDFNISFNKSKITSLPGGSIQLGQLNNDGRGLVAIAQEGQPLGTFYGYVSEGVDPATGNIKYKDIDASGDLSDGDKTIIGNANPKYTFGLANDFKYKNWSFNIFFQGVQGNDIFNATRIDTEGMYNANNQLTTVLNRWTTAGQITDMPRADFAGTNNVLVSSRYVEDGSYVRLKSLTLGYDFPENLVSKLSMSKVRFYLTAENLFTWTKYSGLDPELSIYGRSNDNSLKNIAPGIDYGTYPQTRDIIFGLNLSF
ncbi:MAG: TonB-dependent receptor [Flavobacterium sp.]|uniref:SusC/RagA family TonB-linked outer membrane protein n=1 Tax=Flavobacterium sp. TaxID=239 RepID=UPI00262D456B|nr:TonB-dependent receptor [Flavobacterium sp.]MDD5150577.1 TonB-dependent receptor [Flavobacterium sp.]